MCNSDAQFKLSNRSDEMQNYTKYIHFQFLSLFKDKFKLNNIRKVLLSFIYVRFRQIIYKILGLFMNLSQSIDLKGFYK